MVASNILDLLDLTVVPVAMLVKARAWAEAKAEAKAEAGYWYRAQYPRRSLF